MNDYWQPIDTAPKKGNVLLFLGEDKICVGYWDACYAEGGWGYNGNSGWVIDGGEECALFHADPTHWMPLPNKPTTETPSLADSMGSPGDGDAV